MRSTALLLSFIFFIHLQAGAQNDWEPAGQLYSDSYVQVSLEYKVSKSICNSGNKPSRYRYVIKGVGRGTNYFVNWSMDFYNCNGELMCLTTSYNVGMIDADGKKEDLDWTFEGEKIDSVFYDVSGSSYAKPGGLKQKPKLTIPQSVSGPTQIRYGETASFSVKGGNLVRGAKWVWYEDQCGTGVPVGEGKNVTLRPAKKTTYFVRGEEPGQNTGCVQVTVHVNPDSEPADDIIAVRKSCSGDRTISLSVKGGHLGQDAEWLWYEGGCNGKLIGSGSTIEVIPANQTQYGVLARGKTNTTACRSTTIDMGADAKDPTGISGSGFVCSGQPVTLQVTGGNTALGQQWVWYSNTIQQNNVAGTGRSLTVIPKASTTYWVRAEGQCGSTASRSLTVEVGGQSSSPTAIYKSRTNVYQGQKNELRVSGGSLGEGSEWVWYRKDCGNGKKLGTGSRLTIRARKQQVIFVRAEGKCGNTGCTSATITPLSRFAFINAGYSFNSSSYLNRIAGNPLNDSLNFTVTIGRVKSSGWYIRAKLGFKKEPATSYETNNTSLVNYDNTYLAKFTGKTFGKRLSISGGAIFGKKHFYTYAGIGYGKHNVYWAFDEFSGSGLKVNSAPKYAKNIEQSVEGVEFEGGVMVRLSFLNIMGGISLLAGPSDTQKTFTDFHLGIGLSF